MVCTLFPTVCIHAYVSIYTVYTVHSMIAIFHPHYSLHYKIHIPNECCIGNTTLSFSSQSPFLNTCGCRTSSISASPTEQWGEWWQKSRWHPGYGTESSLNRVQLPWGGLLLCVSWRTQSRKWPVPEAEQDGPGLSETASLSSLCNWGEEIFGHIKS